MGDNDANELHWKPRGGIDWVERLYVQSIRAHEKMIAASDKKLYPTQKNPKTQTAGYIEEKLYQTALSSAKLREEIRMKKLEKIKEPCAPAAKRPLAEVIDHLYETPRTTRPLKMQTLTKKLSHGAVLPKVKQLPSSTVNAAVDRLYSSASTSAKARSTLDRRFYPEAEELVLDATELADQVRRLHDDDVAERAARHASAAVEADWKPLGASGLMARAHSLGRKDDDDGKML